YDVAGYRDIDPMFGSMADAEQLVKEAHEHGLRLIVDLVPNHTSDQHRWFREALASGPGSAARGRYLFRRGRAAGAQPPNDWLSVFGGPAWKQVPDGEWYLHLFAPEQPDLDWTNPEVVAEFHDILRFWLDLGVDGFRIDVAHGLAKDPGMPDVGEDAEDILEPTTRIDHPFWDRDEVHDVYRGWRELTDGYDGDRMLVGEAWVATARRRARYVRPGELHSAFNFDFLRCAWDAQDLRSVIDTCRAADSAVGAPTTWVLSNHDVTREVTRYGGGSVGLRRARAAALLMLALPGGAYVYQGEELGLEEVEDLPEEMLQDPTWLRSGRTVRGRDGCRVPIPWSTEGPSLGFGPGRPWLPQPEDWAQRSVRAQEGAAGSTLELYRSALRYRRDQLLGDDLAWLDAPAGSLAFRRRTSDGGELVCAVNLGPAAVPLPAHDRLVLASARLDRDELPPDTAAWLRLR
ncbi:MAG: alpha-amylase family glycosyl hydrolase, partial [Actinomycetes bacterium]